MYLRVGHERFLPYPFQFIIRFPIIERSRYSSAGIVSRLLAGTFGVRFPPGATYFSILQNVQSFFGAHPASYSIGTGVLSRE